ncbi:hypothetical protein SNE40_020682 [Patella caerulea]|uniref:Uncharacterized protein n=1 Tax=Patella caerulea TaxID=87958 RepID=A0AAN8J5I6_PATCE
MHPGGKDKSYGDVQRRNTVFCDISKERILKIVENQVSKSCPQNTPFTVAEFGAADGSVSMELMTDIIGVVRSNCGKDKEILIMYEDHAGSDFNSLHRRLQGILPNPRSYLLDHENVYVTSSATNFYQQCFPSNSVDLALSFVATHWLSKHVHLTDHVYHYFTHHQDEKTAIEKQAADDWLLFLKNRTKELKQGGWGIFSTMGARDNTTTMTTTYDTFIIINDIWKSFLSRGIITKDEFKRGTFALSLRNPHQLERPFHDSTELQNDGLKLYEIRVDTVPNFHVSDWKKQLEKGIDDNETFVRDFTKYTKTYSYSTFHAALGAERDEEQKLQICELLFKEMHDLVLSKDPREFDKDHIVTSAYVFKD